MDFFGKMRNCKPVYRIQKIGVYKVFFGSQYIRKYGGIAQEMSLKLYSIIA